MNEGDVVMYGAAEVTVHKILPDGRVIIRRSKGPGTTVYKTVAARELEVIA